MMLEELILNSDFQAYLCLYFSLLNSTMRIFLNVEQNMCNEWNSAQSIKVYLLTEVQKSYIFKLQKNLSYDSQHQ